MSGVGIHIVSVTPRNTRLTLGNYIADILIDRKSAPCCYYIIQRVGSAEIFDLERFDSFAKAEEAAKERLEELHAKEAPTELRTA